VEVDCRSPYPKKWLLLPGPEEVYRNTIFGIPSAYPLRVRGSTGLKKTNTESGFRQCRTIDRNIISAIAAEVTNLRRFRRDKPP
jgi:hypothetical protein